MIDRFNTNEDLPKQDTKAFRQGIIARKCGKSLDDNPYKNSSSDYYLKPRYRSWVWGWADEDMNQLHNELK